MRPPMDRDASNGHRDEAGGGADLDLKSVGRHPDWRLHVADMLSSSCSCNALRKM